jgi:hypothetical protein
MYWQLFWTWLRKGYLAILIGNVFIPVPLWAVIVAALVLSLVIVFLMSSKRSDKISG